MENNSSQNNKTPLTANQKKFLDGFFQVVKKWADEQKSKKSGKMVVKHTKRQENIDKLKNELNNIFNT